MKMIRKKEYRGIEFIQLSDLNDTLQEEIKNWLNEDMLIKIKMEDCILRDCIQMKDFLYWYENLYTSTNVVKEQASKRVTSTQSSVLVLEG
jgi:hypothetical protein